VVQADIDDVDDDDDDDDDDWQFLCICMSCAFPCMCVFSSVCSVLLCFVLFLFFC